MAATDPILPSASTAALRWRLLRRVLLPSARGSGGVVTPHSDLSKVSRRPAGRYNLVPGRVITDPESHECQDVVVEYTLPACPSVKLALTQRREGCIGLKDLEASRRGNSIDSTGVACLWPAEEVLAHFCARQPEIFRGKTVIELGSGYGLGGLAVAACTEAAEVLITDGNPSVMEYVRANIAANSGAFGSTRVRGEALHWRRDGGPRSGRQTFDLVVAADCTFFEEFHADLAGTIKSLLGIADDARGLLFNPQRGNTLDLFVRAAVDLGLRVEITESYDAQVWDAHQQLVEMGEQMGWPNYDGNHCYPLLACVRSAGVEKKVDGGSARVV